MSANSAGVGVPLVESGQFLSEGMLGPKEVAADCFSGLSGVLKSSNKGGGYCGRRDGGKGVQYSSTAGEKIGELLEVCRLTAAKCVVEVKE